MLLLLARPSFFVLVLWVLLLCFGLFIFAAYVNFQVNQLTPEDELTVVEAIPSKIKTSALGEKLGEKRFIKFNVGEFRSKYSSDEPFAEEVFDAIQSQQTVRAGVATEEKGLIKLGSDYVRLYKLELGDRVVLPYEATIAARRREGMVLLFGAMFFLIVGATGLWSGLRRCRQYRDQARVAAEGRS
jgi:hypothetical protein